jgi:hypothetical protein
MFNLSAKAPVWQDIFEHVHLMGYLTLARPHTGSMARPFLPLVVAGEDA